MRATLATGESSGVFRSSCLLMTAFLSSSGHVIKMEPSCSGGENVGMVLRRADSMSV